SSAGRNGLLARILADDADAILGTLAQVPHETFEAVVEAIATARRTYVVGFRGSAGIALVLGMGLRIYLPETRVIAVNVGDAAEELLSLRRGDLVIVISLLRYARPKRCGTGSAFTRATNAERIAEPSEPAQRGPKRVLRGPGHACTASNLSLALSPRSAHQWRAACDRVRAQPRR